MNFQISGLPFAPIRVSLAHAALGEELLLIAYEHQSARVDRA